MQFHLTEFWMVEVFHHQVRHPFLRGDIQPLVVDDALMFELLGVVVRSFQMRDGLYLGFALLHREDPVHSPMPASKHYSVGALADFIQ